MSCLFPDNAASTAYVKGCRCRRCRDEHAAIRLRAVARKASGEAPPTLPTARYPVPSELVMRHVNAWLEERTKTWDPHQKNALPLSPMQQLGERTGRRNVARAVWRLERECETTSFAIADMFISAIDPRLWHTDPELHAILEGLPDNPVDDNETEGLLTDEEIRQWAIDTRESMTPAGWKQLRKALAWFAPDLPELEAA